LEAPRGAARATPATAATPSPWPGAEFFSNQYTVAEADYRKYIASNPGDPAGHVAYALFLNYNRRFSEALAEIQTAVGQAPRDAFAGRRQHPGPRLVRTIDGGHQEGR